MRKLEAAQGGRWSLHLPAGQGTEDWHANAAATAATATDSPSPEELRRWASLIARPALWWAALAVALRLALWALAALTGIAARIGAYSEAVSVSSPWLISMAAAGGAVVLAVGQRRSMAAKRENVLGGDVDH